MRPKLSLWLKPVCQGAKKGLGGEDGGGGGGGREGGRWGIQDWYRSYP